jgi:hypothetical protein
VPYASSGETWDANKCVPVMGDQAPGEPCTYGGIEVATDDCDATSACWGVMQVGLELKGNCVPICMGSEDNPMCPTGWSCLISSRGSLGLCAPNCDPLVQDCGAGLGCYWASSDFHCSSAGDIPVGEPCELFDDCADGNPCILAEQLPDCAGSSCCSTFCDVSAPTCSLPGTTCVAIFEPGRAPPLYDDVGICMLP